MAWIAPITNHNPGDTFTTNDYARIGENVACLVSERRPAERNPDSYQYTQTQQTDMLSTGGFRTTMLSAVRRWNRTHPDDQIPETYITDVQIGFLTAEQVNNCEERLDYLIEKICTVED